MRWNFSHRHPSCTRQRCSGMYNIWHWLYTFPYQWIWTMSTLILMTGIEMITKHLSCSFNLHPYVQRKRKKNIQEDHKLTSPSSSFVFFNNYKLPFSNAYEAKTLAMATCIKRRLNVLKIWPPYPFSPLVKNGSFLWEQP